MVCQQANIPVYHFLSARQLYVSAQNKGFVLAVSIYDVATDSAQHIEPGAHDDDFVCRIPQNNVEKSCTSLKLARPCCAHRASRYMRVNRCVRIGGEVPLTHLLRR